jgi:hypothetical protein
MRLIYLDEQARSWGPPVRTGSRLLHYPSHCGIFVTGFPNEARYSLISVCNEL